MLRGEPDEATTPRRGPLHRGRAALALGLAAAGACVAATRRASHKPPSSSQAAVPASAEFAAAAVAARDETTAAASSRAPPTTGEVPAADALGGLTPIASAWQADDAGSGAPARRHSDEARPNLVVLTLDDVGYNDFGYQSSDLHSATPHIDALALRGVRLTSYYGQPSCSPARAALLASKWVHRLGFQDVEVMSYSNFSVPLRHTLMPARLRAAGYSTFGVGKWNIGHCAEAYLPWNRGACCEKPAPPPRARSPKTPSWESSILGRSRRHTTPSDGVRSS